MDCCSRHVGAAQNCFGWMSKMYERRYRRKGLDANQLQMVEALESNGLEGVSLLDVGCGVGALHQTLLEKGAASAVGIDLAPRMLELAEIRARELQLDQRTSYKPGDFVEMSDAIWASSETPQQLVATPALVPASLALATLA